MLSPELHIFTLAQTLPQQHFGQRHLAAQFARQSDVPLLFHPWQKPLRHSLARTPPPHLSFGKTGRIKTKRFHIGTNQSSPFLRSTNGEVAVTAW
jgi:hypothetical protein